MVPDSADLRRDRSSGAVLLGAAAAYLWLGRGYSLDTLADPGPGLFPRAVGLSLAALGAAQLVLSGARLRRTAFPAEAARADLRGPVGAERARGLMAQAGRGEAVEPRPGEPVRPPSTGSGQASTGSGRTVAATRVAVLVGILVLYAAVLSLVGFLASTFCLTVACCKLMGARGWARPLALAAGVLLACQLVFAAWLEVPLPTGFLR